MIADGVNGLATRTHEEILASVEAKIGEEKSRDLENLSLLVDVARANPTGENLKQVRVLLDLVEKRYAAGVDIAPADPWNWIDATELSKPLPPVPWVVRELQLGPGRPCSVQAYGAGMKSLSVCSAVVSIAAGLPVWGAFSTGRPRKVAWWGYEMGRRADTRRIQRTAIGLNVDLSSLAIKLTALPRMKLTDPGAREAFMRGAEGMDVGVVDSLRASLRGVEENDSMVRDYVDLLLEVSEKTGITWIVIHHVGKTKDGHDDARQKGRGSSALFDAWGTVLDLTKESESIRKVTMTKPHPEAAGSIEPFCLEVTDVPRGSDPIAGVRVTHKTIEQVEGPKKATASRLDELKEEIVGLLSKGAQPSRNRIIDRIRGTRTIKLAALSELLEEGRVVEVGGQFRVS